MPLPRIVALLLGSACCCVRWLSAQPNADDPRRIAATALVAAERGGLDQWAAIWRARLLRTPNDRPAVFATATADRLRYRYKRADSLYARVIGFRADDAFGRQAQLSRLTMAVVQGRQVSAPKEALAIAESALQHADTLTALDALLVRAATLLRLEGTTAASAVLARGDALSWTREPALDAAARCRLAAVRSREGAGDDARRLAREGERIATGAGLTRQAANCLFILGTEFATAGLTDSLGVSLLRAMEIQQRGGDVLGLASSSQWAGYYSISLGQYQLAQQYLAKAWGAAEHTGSREGMAWTSLNRASLALSFFDAVAARKWLIRSDSLMRLIGDVYGSVAVARNRAELAAAIGDTASANASLRNASVLVERLNEPNMRVGLLASQVLIARRNAQLDLAAQLLQTMDSLITRYGLPGWRMSVMAEQSALALRRGNGRDAERLLRVVLDSVDPGRHSYHRHELEVQYALAIAMNGNTHVAGRVALVAAASFDQWRASLTDSTQRLLAVESTRGIGPYMSALVGRLADAEELDVAFALTERRRARDLRDRLLLASAWQQPVAPHRATESILARDADSVDVRGLQRTIPDSTTAVVTIDAGANGERGTAFVVTRTAITAHVMPSADVVAPHVRRLVALLETGRDASVETRALGNMLIAPLLSRLERGGVTRIVFVPEGVLHRLPFAALRLPDGRHMIERFETSVAPSLTVLARLRASPSSRRDQPQLLAIADPTSSRGTTSYPSTDASVGARLMAAMFGTRAYPALAGARDEVARMQRAMPGTVIRTGRSASEFAFKRDAGKYDVLHLATHAAVDEWSGAQAALALAGGDGDDGLLESSEIAALRLTASLVVLSACRTVGGEVLAGEGVRGLTTAFLAAGVRSVVATSWRVDDRAVAPFVGLLYDALARGTMVGAALREAQLSAIRRGTPMSVWGAFSVVGDPWRRVREPH